MQARALCFTATGDGRSHKPLGGSNALNVNGGLAHRDVIFLKITTV